MGWVLDLDGVVRIGSTPVDGAAEAVARLQRAGEQVVFVTNLSAITVADQEQMLADIGVEARGSVITSAVAAARLVEPGERVLVVGGEGIREAVTERGATLVDRGPADVVVVGITSDFDYDWLTRAGQAIHGGARLVGTNHDPTFPTPDGLLPGGGAVLAAVAVAGDVEPVVAGKPNEAIAGCVRERLGADGIVVGDRADTDGAFARALGYRFGLVLTGVTAESDLPVEPTPDVVADSLLDLVRDHQSRPPNRRSSGGSEMLRDQPG